MLLSKFARLEVEVQEPLGHAVEVQEVLWREGYTAQAQRPYHRHMRQECLEEAIQGDDVKNVTVMKR